MSYPGRCAIKITPVAGWWKKRDENPELTVEKKELCVPAVFSSLEKISDFIQQQAHQSRLSFKKTWELMLVMDELCCSIISHGRSCSGKHVLFLRWKEEPEYITIQLSDNGIPFNPLLPCAEEKEVVEETKRLGGMGPHLIEKMIDGVSYHRENGYNFLCLSKFKGKRNHGNCSGKKGNKRKGQHKEEV